VVERAERPGLVASWWVGERSGKRKEE